MNVNASSGFVNAPAWAAGSGTSAQKILWTFGSTPTLTNLSSAAQVSVDPDLANNGTFDGHPFIVRVTGKAAVVTTATVTIGLYNDTAATVTAGNLVASTGASASVTGSASAAVNFLLEAYLLWNSTPATLSGQQKGFINSVAGSQTNVASTAISTQTLAPASTGLGFSVAITYSAGNTGSLVTLSEFSIERV